MPTRQSATAIRKLTRRLARLLALPAITALGTLCLTFYQPFWLVRAAQALLPDVLFYVETHAPLVALTFDDGPDGSVTPKVLDVLRRERVSATWFVIGERVKRYPELMRIIVEDGHQVANHFWSETPTWRLDRMQFRRELLRTEALITQHARPRLMRPASGWIRPWGLREGQTLGFTIVLGSGYANDPMRPPRRYLEWALTRMARPGAILVLHVGPGRRLTPEVLPNLIRGIRAKGLRFATVSHLLAHARREETSAAHLAVAPHGPESRDFAERPLQRPTSQSIFERYTLQDVCGAGASASPTDLSGVRWPQSLPTCIPRSAPWRANGMPSSWLTTTSAPRCRT